MCNDCRTESSTLAATINASSAPVQPDEVARTAGLASVRSDGYKQLLIELDRHVARGDGQLLEVGSSFGWFLAEAESRFSSVVGIEPDDDVRPESERGARDIRAGYFPAAVHEGETFDVVVFNDVFEHIPDASAAARAVAASLVPGGIAVINLPVCSGVVYRMTKIACRLGVRGPFERMWQMRFPSPHLYYFSEGGLRRLFTEAGLEYLAQIDMPTIRLKGLWPRIRHAEPSLRTAVLSYAASLLIVPVVKAGPADVECFFFRAVEGRTP